MSHEAQSALSVRDLQVRLRGQQDHALVRGIDLDLPAGEITGLVGASGSGKTVTSLALMGLTPRGVFDVSASQFQVTGREVDITSDSQLHDLRGNSLAMVFQDPATALDPVQRVGQQIAAPLRRHGRIVYQYGLNFRQMG